MYQALNEVQIYEYMKETKQLDQCLSSDIEEISSDEELDKVSNCFIGKLGDKDLEELEKRLSLTKLNVIPDKEPGVIRKYLKKRLKEGLYGDLIENTNPELSQKKLKIVNPEVFTEIHKNQLTNNMLFEVSTFCLKNSSSQGKSYTQKIKNALKGMSAPKAQRIFNNCLKLIETSKCSETSSSWSTPSSQLSICALKRRLQDYRRVLAKIEKNQNTLKNIKNDTYFDSQSFGYETYKEGEGNGEKSIQELNNFTSSDALSAFSEDENNYFSAKNEKFLAACSTQNLNEKECEKIVKRGELEDFNKLKLSVMNDYNLKAKKYKQTRNKDELIKVIKNDFQLSEKELSRYASMEFKDIQKSLEKSLTAYKVSVINEINEKLEERMLSSKNLSQQKEKLKNISEEILSEGELLQKALNFHNAISSQWKLKDSNSGQEFQHSSPIEAEKKGLSHIQNNVSDPEAYEWIKNLSYETSINSNNKSLEGSSLFQSGGIFKRLFD